MELNDLTPTNRYKLLKVLGGKCRICPLDEIKHLEIDHIYNDGAEERTKYGSTEKIYGWYLQHENQAFRRLQPLCKEHHYEKHYSVGITDFGILAGKPRAEVSQMQTFLGVLKDMEGDRKFPIPINAFIIRLVLTDQFTEQEAKDYIEKMNREASIYESKPGCYNRV